MYKQVSGLQVCIYRKQVTARCIYKCIYKFKEDLLFIQNLTDNGAVFFETKVITKNIMQIFFFEDPFQGFFRSFSKSLISVSITGRHIILPCSKLLVTKDKNRERLFLTSVIKWQVLLVEPGI